MTAVSLAWLSEVFLRRPAAAVRRFDRRGIGGAFAFLAGVLWLAGRALSETSRWPVQRHLLWLAAVLFGAAAVWLWLGVFHPW